jgi:hypothetical protein
MSASCVKGRREDPAPKQNVVATESCGVHLVDNVATVIPNKVCFSYEYS